MGLDLTTDDDALLVVADLLASEPSDSPDGGTDARRTRGAGRERYAVLPSFEHPRYLLPVDAPQAAAGDLKAGRGALSGLVVRALVQPAVRLGGLRAVPGRTLVIAAGGGGRRTLTDRLGQSVDCADATISVALGPPRLNRKPVVRVTAPDGRVLAYAKVGLGSHAAALVDVEASFLAGDRASALAGARVVAPQVVERFAWKGCPVAVYSPLAVRRRVRQRPLAPTAAIIRAIAASGPGERTEVSASHWWKDIEQQLATLPPPLRDRALAAAEAVDSCLAGTVLPFGNWHGDLASWNAQWAGRRLLVWDWERTGGPVPVGFDAVHGSFQHWLLSRRSSVTEARAAAETAQGRLLIDLGVPPGAVPGLVLAYCLHLALRLQRDVTHGPGPDSPVAGLVHDLLTDLMSAGRR